MVRIAEARAAAVAVLVGFALASCGGRASTPRTDSSTSGSSGQPAQGGTSAVSGGAGRGITGGSSSGGAAAAGGNAISDAGPPACNDSCPEVDCPPSQTIRYPEAMCCPVCVACDAADVAACGASPDCGPSGHPEIRGGNCCAACVANDAALCAKQSAASDDVRNTLYGKYQGTCQTDADCASAFIDTNCPQGCLYALKGTITAYAADVTKLEDCSACPLPAPAQRACLVPHCWRGACVDGIPAY